MKIRIPKVIVPVELSEYHAELAGQKLYVWINPPMAKLQAYNDLVNSLEQQELEAARQAMFPEKENDAKPEQSQSSLLKAFHSVGGWLRFRKMQSPEGLNPRLLEWYAEIWSQGPDGTHWTVDELRMSEIEDPAFLSWMIAQTWRMRAEHIERKKKA